MSRPLRFVPEEYTNWTDSYGRDIAVVEITTRTLLGMFLLKPTPHNRSLIVGVMAHVQERLKFDVYGYAWLSNHGSYLVGVTGPKHQSAIMREIHGQLARESSAGLSVVTGMVASGADEAGPFSLPTQWTK